MFDRIASPASTTPLRAALATLAGLLALPGCPVDSNDDIGETTTMTTTVSTSMSTSMSTTMSDSSSESGGSETEVGPVDFETDLQPIWDAQCVALCHEPGGTWGPPIEELDMRPGMAYMALLEGDPSEALIPYVTPNEPENSYILYKLRGTMLDAPGGGSGVQMPQAKPPLPESDIAKIEAWIMQGAPE